MTRDAKLYIYTLYSLTMNVEWKNRQLSVIMKSSSLLLFRLCFFFCCFHQPIDIISWLSTRVHSSESTFKAYEYEYIKHRYNRKNRIESNNNLIEEYYYYYYIINSPLKFFVSSSSFHLEIPLLINLEFQFFFVFSFRDG